MGFFEAIFKALFGWMGPKKAAPAPKPAPQPAPKPAPQQPAPQPTPTPAPQAPAEPAPAPQPAPHFLDTLVAADRAPLAPQDYDGVAANLGCEVAVIRAFFTVETGGASGFEPDGKPTILYEPHIFSRRTNHAFDASNPTVSYPRWDRTKYPKNQAGRWAQMRVAYGLDAENALCSASWGAFQVMGFHFQRCGFATAHDFVADMSRSQARQLAAFERFVASDAVLKQACRDKNWDKMAERYNGSGQVEIYAPRLKRAYEQASAQPTS